MTMRHTTCYPIAGKAKSRLLCDAFAAGVAARGGTAAVCDQAPAQLLRGAAVFYGVDASNAHLWREAQATGRDWYYLDNAYFDRGRGTYFRCTRNALQDDGCGRPDAQRMKRLGLTVAPWRQAGREIVIVLQSESFMREVAAYAGDWLTDVRLQIRQVSERPTIVRAWRRDKAAQMATLKQDLAFAWALVTHSSAAANEALLAGIPVCVTAPCAAERFAAPIERIEAPELPAGREQWAGALCARQWTLDELRAGAAWAALNEPELAACA